MVAFQTLASFIQSTGRGTVPQEIRHQAGIVLADTLGAILVGWREPEVRAVLARYGDVGRARIFGLRRRAASGESRPPRVDIEAVPCW